MISQFDTRYANEVNIFHFRLKSALKWEAEDVVCLARVDAAVEEAGAEHAAADLVWAVDLRRDALLCVQKRNFGGLKN